jgi:3-dehydroquinate synthase
VVVLGGGVAGDTAGFAAATYMRGVPLVQCPTTLLAMVDSSIGGKVGVDLPEGKNLVGAFWQPALVWADLSVLKTLPDREWRTGLAEIIKYGLIGDRWILSVLESRDLYSLRRDVVLTERLIARSIAIKADVVGSDERETRGHREVLNLGHTFGHAIESVSGYRGYTHGEAIAVGMCAAARLSVRLGLLPGPAADRIERLFRRWGLPVRVRRRLPRPAVLSALSRDKKNLNGRFRFVLPVRGGTVRVVDNPPKRALEEALSDSGL